MNEMPTDAELTRLADGTLPEERAATLRARIAADPDLARRLREQERAVGLVRSTESVVAPASLHAAVHGRVSRTGRGRRRASAPRRRAELLLAFAGAASVAAIALVVILLLARGSHGLTVGRTAAVAIAPPTRGAPAVAPGDRDLLSLRVGPIAFPSYEQRDGWRASGARTDRLGGRRVQTVDYEIGDRRVGYSIVAGAALPVPAGRSESVGGVRYVSRSSGGTRLITWRRAGHTCVIAGRDIPARTLLGLAVATQAT